MDGQEDEQNVRDYLDGGDASASGGFSLEGQEVASHLEQQLADHGDKMGGSDNDGGNQQRKHWQIGR